MNITATSISKGRSIHFSSSFRMLRLVKNIFNSINAPFGGRYFIFFKEVSTKYWCSIKEIFQRGLNESIVKKSLNVDNALLKYTGRCRRKCKINDIAVRMIALVLRSDKTETRMILPYRWNLRIKAIQILYLDRGI